MSLPVVRIPAGQMVPHEFGHALGFAHEFERGDFIDEGGECSSDQPVPGGDTLGTNPDRWSIMASSGYCNWRTALSWWDRVGANNAYLRRRGESKVSSFDGDTRAEVLFHQPTVNELWVTPLRLLRKTSGFGRNSLARSLSTITLGTSTETASLTSPTSRRPMSISTLRSRPPRRFTVQAADGG
jgi:hypothetical protein